jgi:hypothetical protein
MGHASTKMTLGVYAHTPDSAQRDAADRIDAALVTILNGGQMGVKF